MPRRTLMISLALALTMAVTLAMAKEPPKKPPKEPPKTVVVKACKKKKSYDAARKALLTEKFQHN